MRRQGLQQHRGPSLLFAPPLQRPIRRRARRERAHIAEFIGELQDFLGSARTGARRASASTASAPASAATYRRSPRRQVRRRSSPNIERFGSSRIFWSSTASCSMPRATRLQTCPFVDSATRLATSIKLGSIRALGGAPLRFWLLCQCAAASAAFKTVRSSVGTPISEKAGAAPANQAPVPWRPSAGANSHEGERSKHTRDWHYTEGRAESHGSDRPRATPRLHKLQAAAGSGKQVPISARPSSMPVMADGASGNRWRHSRALVTRSFPMVPCRWPGGGGAGVSKNLAYCQSSLPPPPEAQYRSKWASCSSCPLSSSETPLGAAALAPGLRSL